MLCAFFISLLKNTKIPICIQKPYKRKLFGTSFCSEKKRVKWTHLLKPRGHIPYFGRLIANWARRKNPWCQKKLKPQDVARKDWMWVGGLPLSRGIGAINYFFHWEFFGERLGTVEERKRRGKENIKNAYKKQKKTNKEQKKKK